MEICSSIRDAFSYWRASKQAKEVGNVGIGLLLMFLAGWALFLPIVFFGVGDGPPLSSLPSWLLEPHTASGVEDSLAVKWWLLWYSSVGGMLTVIPVLLANVRLRNFISHKLPMAPAVDGQPPRCRVCGADLPAKSGVLACTYCGASHVADGKSFQRSVSSIDRQLSQMERNLSHELDKRSAPANWGAYVGGLAPVGLIIVAPVGLLVGQTFPVLWAVPALLGVVAGLLFVLVLLRPLPKIAKKKTLDELFGGDFVLVDGERRGLLGAVYFSRLWNGWSGHFKVLADASGNPSHLVSGVELYPIRPGGSPLTEQDLSAAGEISDIQGALGVVDVIRPSGPLAAVKLRCLKHEADAQPRTSIRVWRAEPTPYVGLAPMFTVDARAARVQSVVPDET